MNKELLTSDIIYIAAADSCEQDKAIAHFLAEKQDGLNGKLILCWNKND